MKDNTAGSPRDSIALVDQLRAVDIQRIRAYLGSLEKEIYEPIRKSLLQIFRLI